MWLELYSLSAQSLRLPPIQGTELPSPAQGSVFPGAELCSLRASAVLKLCRIQGKSAPGQSLCSYPSGSFQLCVGSMSTSFVRETQESSSAKVLFTVPRLLTRKLKGFTFIKEREIAQPDCHERKEPTLITLSVCRFFFTFLICLVSHPGGGGGGLSPFQTRKN